MNKTIKDFEEKIVDEDIVFIVEQDRYRVLWSPKEDITAYELAKCMSYLNNTGFFYKNILPTEDIERHFIINKI